LSYQLDVKGDPWKDQRKLILKRVTKNQ